MGDVCIQLDDAILADITAPLWIGQQYWKPRHWGRLGCGYRAGIYPNQEEFAKTWQRDAQLIQIWQMTNDQNATRHGNARFTQHCLFKADQYDECHPFSPMWHGWQGWQKRQTRCLGQSAICRQNTNFPTLKVRF